jgi:predicted Zn-dependent peptidase
VVFQKSVLTNGLRVVTEEDPHFHSVAVGVWLNAGSRDEAQEENGLSHFLEHMAFKGTPRLSALDIAREIDQLGGSCNAFTSKENTCYHGKVLSENLPRAVDLLSDLVLHPSYHSQDLERERQVILEEICAQEDNPEDQVQVHFARGFWGDDAFGRPILGEEARISQVTREQLLAYRGIAYRPETTIIAAAGRVNHQELLDLITSRFRDFHNGAPPRQRGRVSIHPGIYQHPRDLEQVHVCLGTRGPAAGDQERYAVTVLQLILGGNMSSRLFQVVREELGLAYNIYSFMSFFSDTGLLGVSAGVSPKNLERLLSATYQEIKKLKTAAVPEEELRAAKEYLRGSIYLHAEDCDHRMLRLAKNEIYFGHYIPLEEIISGLQQVTAAEIQDLAQELFDPQNWGLALLGPVEGEVGVDF